MISGRGVEVGDTTLKLAHKVERPHVGFGLLPHDSPLEGT